MGDEATSQEPAHDRECAGGAINPARRGKRERKARGDEGTSSADPPAQVFGTERASTSSAAVPQSARSPRKPRSCVVGVPTVVEPVHVGRRVGGGVKRCGRAGPGRRASQSSTKSSASPMPTPKQSSARGEANSPRPPLSPRRPPRCSSSLRLPPCWQRQSHEQLRLSHGRRPRTCTTRRATAGAVSRRTARLARALTSRGTRESQVRPCSRPVLTLQPTGRSSPACTTFSASSPFVRSTPLLDDSLTHSCVPRSLSRSHTAQSFPKSRSRPRNGSSRSRSAFTARQRLG